MAELYMVAEGHDNTAGYGTLDPQPGMKGMKDGRRTMGGDQLIYADGFRNATLAVGFMTKADFQDYCENQLFIGDGTPSAKVTIRLPRNKNRSFADHNATIEFPDLPDDAFYDMTRYQEIKFKVHAIREI